MSTTTTTTTILPPTTITTSRLDSSTTNHGFPVPRGPVTSSLQFYNPPADGAKPFFYVESTERNFSDIEHDVSINDLRGQESKFTLDSNAFAAISGVASKETEFNDDEHIKRVYYPEVEKFILDNVPGANRVLLFDHTIRRAKPDAHRSPVRRVHIDQTPKSAEQRVRFHLPDEADELLKGRYRIINVWKPFDTVVSFPLAVADSATVADEDLVGVEHRYPDRTGETAGVKYNPNQRWYYWSGMQPTERLLLKCFDSDETVGRWGRVPHTAFVDPRTPDGAPGRESIEVRALVFG